MYTEEGEKNEKVGKDCDIIFTDKEETADSRIENLYMNIGMNIVPFTLLRQMDRNRIRF